MASIPKVPEGKYPLIDSDPHITRVVRFFRLSDYGYWLGMTAAAPLVVGLGDYNKYMSNTSTYKETYQALYYAIRSRKNIFGNWPAVFIGCVGGFLFAYARSNARFLGFSENSREVKKDMKEMRVRAKMGLPLYGTSSLRPELQEVASSYSTMSFFNFAVIPMFNFVNHPYHGVDTSKYYGKN
ncbi:NADH-ubiquinone oxidoreductase complex I, 21 kDa subunit-domain-containing protein [Lipomyces arxii]|uniref:NADH-ubiquinone oxidoreductase complex I, 21 kDa subunit-domain-containing protein n=1 Tax=Lipomyces arxii TaxID=56418 RepID=UPI0034CE8431